MTVTLLLVVAAAATFLSGMLVGASASRRVHGAAHQATGGYGRDIAELFTSRVAEIATVRAVHDAVTDEWLATISGPGFEATFTTPSGSPNGRWTLANLLTTSPDAPDFLSLHGGRLTMNDLTTAVVATLERNRR